MRFVQQRINLKRQFNVCLIDLKKEQKKWIQNMIWVWSEIEHFLKVKLDQSEIDVNECEHFLKVKLDQSEIDVNECEHFLKMKLDPSWINLIAVRMALGNLIAVRMAPRFEVVPSFGNMHW